MQKDKAITSSQYIGFGLIFGVAAGAFLGVMLGNLALGLGPGIGIGLAVGALLAHRSRASRQGDSRD